MYRSIDGSAHLSAECSDPYCRVLSRSICSNEDGAPEMPAIPLKDKPEGQPPSRWQITVPKSIIVILVLLGIVALLLAKEGHRYAAEHPSPRVFSIAGVTFKVKDEETMVLPMSFMSEEERHKKVSKVYAFSLCAHLPDMNFYGDRESRKGCMDVGFKESDWLMLGVSGNSLNRPPPPPENRPAETVGFARILRSRIGLSDNDLSNTKRYKYMAGDDLYGLHMFYPTENVDPSRETVFWYTPDSMRVDTLILCVGYLPQQRTKLWPTSGCHHDFYLPASLFSGYTVEVNMSYDVRWLPHWQEIESKARETILGLRIDPSTLNSGDKE